MNFRVLASLIALSLSPAAPAMGSLTPTARVCIQGLASTYYESTDLCLDHEEQIVSKVVADGFLFVVPLSIADGYRVEILSPSAETVLAMFLNDQRKVDVIFVGDSAIAEYYRQDITNALDLIQDNSTYTF